MNSSTDHMIRSINWNIQAGSYDEAVRINNSVQELSKVIGDTVAEVSTQYDIAEPLFLDQVVIELGSLNESELEEQLRQKLAEALHHTISDQLPITTEYSSIKPESDEPRGKNSGVRDESIVFHFLQKGTLPWWTEGIGIKQISTLLMKLIRSQNQHTNADLIQVFKDEKAAYRLIHQFEEEEVYEVVAALVRTDPKRLKSQLEFIRKFISAVNDENHESIESLLIDVSTQASLLSSERQLIDFLGERTLVITEGRIQNPALIDKQSRNEDERRFSTLLLDRMNEMVNARSKPNHIELLEDQSTKTPESSRLESEPEEALPNESPSLLEQQENSDSEREEYFIKNSGLVILWPYLQKFLGSLGLIQNGSFVNESSQAKAIHLLQFLGEGSKEQPEYRLMLNKLLCGLEIEIPIPRKFKLTEKEEGACNELLEAVIRNWDALKGTSIEGLQSSFLMREGKLSKSSQGWTLVVESKAYDLLLDKMPWSISIIKLPWMNEPLYVEWT